MLKEGLMAAIVDGGDAVVHFSVEHRRKGTVDCAISRAPLDAKFYQRNEDDEALLLSSTAAPGVAGIGVAVWLLTD
jgi:hypothetical protein